MNLAVNVFTSPADAILCNSQVTGSSTTISSLDIPGNELSDLKIAKPLRKRGAGAAIGEMNESGNHNFDEFDVPGMHENDCQSHRTPLGLIPQSPSGNRRLSAELMQNCNNSKFGMQGEVA